jgi:hypothetical protein
MWHVLGTKVMDTGYWLRDLTERDHLEDLGIEKKVILKRIFKKEDMDARWRALGGVVVNIRVS